MAQDRNAAPQPQWIYDENGNPQLAHLMNGQYYDQSGKPIVGAIGEDRPIQLQMQGPDGGAVPVLRHSNGHITTLDNQPINNFKPYVEQPATQYGSVVPFKLSSGRMTFVGVGRDGSLTDIFSKQPLGDADKQAFAVQAAQAQPSKEQQTQAAEDARQAKALSAQQKIKLAGVEAAKSKQYAQFQAWQDGLKRDPQSGNYTDLKSGNTYTPDELNQRLNSAKDSIESEYTNQRNALLGQQAQPVQFGQQPAPANAAPVKTQGGSATNPSPANGPSATKLPLGKGQPLTDVAIAKQFLDAAGGDKVKAQRLATLNGWKF